MPKITMGCNDCGRHRSLHYVELVLDSPTVFDLDEDGWHRDRVRWRCVGGCKQTTGFWERLGQSSLSEIFHRKLWTPKEVFDD